MSELMDKISRDFLIFVGSTLCGSMLCAALLDMIAKYRRKP